jgi:hypothetical protein
MPRLVNYKGQWLPAARLWEEGQREEDKAEVWVVFGM